MTFIIYLYHRFKFRIVTDVLKSHLIFSSDDDKLIENYEIDYLNILNILIMYIF